MEKCYCVLKLYFQHEFGQIVNAQNLKAGYSGLYMLIYSIMKVQYKVSRHNIEKCYCFLKLYFHHEFCQIVGQHLTVAGYCELCILIWNALKSKKKINK